MTAGLRTIPVPAAVAGLAGLEPVHYDEAFTFDTDVSRRPEEWARLILEGASPRERAVMLATWTALGIRLAWLGSRGQVLGWRILHNGPDGIVLGVRAALGLTARVVVRVEPGRVVHAMLVRYDRGLGRRIWAKVAPGHHRFVAGLLERASRRPVPAGERSGG
jgi:hypothetical protein